jgi:hypothetical protein
MAVLIGEASRGNSRGPGAISSFRQLAGRHSVMLMTTIRRGGVHTRWWCTVELRPRSDARGQGTVAS